jgi:hypothetical protein
MTEQEALQFAKKYHLKYWYKRKKLYVLVYPGDLFHQADGVWEPIEKKGILYHSGKAAI